MVQIEIYDQRELTEDGEAQVDTEAIKLIEDLGLEGQQALVNPSMETVCRYNKLTREQAFTIRMLFSAHALVKDYNQGPIPVRVLKEIRFAKDHFKDLYILFAPPAEVIDPILVGFNGSYFAGSIGESSLIARWGDALKPWSELFNFAMLKHKEKLRRKLGNFISRCQSQLSLLDTCEPSIINEPTLYNLPFDD